MSYTSISSIRSHRYPLMGSQNLSGDCGCGCGGSGGCGGMGQETLTEQEKTARTVTTVTLMGATALGLFLVFGGKKAR